MKLFLLSAFALFFSCARAEFASAQTPCATRCGLKAPGNCVELQGLEDEFLWRMTGPLKTDPGSMCTALGEWTAYVHVYKHSDHIVCPSGGAWPLPLSGACALGYTHAETRGIEVTSLEWHQNALPHELVHAVEIVTAEHAGHCAWESRGIKGALQTLTGVRDWTPSVCP